MNKVLALQCWAQFDTQHCIWPLGHHQGTLEYRTRTGSQVLQGVVPILSPNVPTNHFSWYPCPPMVSFKSEPRLACVINKNIAKIMEYGSHFWNKCSRDIADSALISFAPSEENWDDFGEIIHAILFFSFAFWVNPKVCSAYSCLCAQESLPEGMGDHMLCIGLNSGRWV